MLDGETVLYGSASELRETLNYDFSQEKNFSYKGLSMKEIIHHLAKFVSGLWQIHIFSENAWYFRNALVRANYNNLVKGIHETTEFLELFLRNLLCDEQNELHNRSMHVGEIYKDYQKANIQTIKANIANLQIYADALNGFSAKTVEHIRKLYGVLGTQSVFGRTDVQEIIKLGNTRTSELIKELVEARIIETVAGYGKGKYRFCGVA